MSARPVALALILWLGPSMSGSAWAPPAASSEAAKPWTARWIGSGESSTENTWLAFRRVFDLPRVPKDAFARVAVDSKYWLWVNGVQVVREGGLGRGPTRTGTYYDRVDLGPYLRAGPNSMAALVWYFGRSGRYHKSSGRAGFLFEMDAGGGSRLVSDAEWRVLRHPAFGDTPPPLPAKFMPPPQVRFDARKDLPDWPLPGFDDRAWAHAVDLGAPPTEPWNALTLRPIPQWRDFGLKSYPATDEKAGPGGIRVLHARLPYNAQITPWLDVEAPEGKIIDIRTDHYLTHGVSGGAHYNVRAEYVTRAGRQTFEATSWMNGEDVQYTIPAGVTVHRLMYRETGYDTDFAGDFASSDPFLNLLWEKARRTLYVNVRDVYMDCPDRERGQWIGDAAVEVPQTFYAFDRGIDALTRKLLDELLGWRADDGRLFTVIPGGNNNELPSQVLHVASRQGIAWGLYDHTGDSSRLASTYEPFKRYLDLWRIGPDGLVEHRAGGWGWFDNATGIDAPVNENAWYHGTLLSLAEVSRLIGRPEDEAPLRERAARLAGAFERAFWRGDAYRSGTDIDDRANGLAVMMGLVPAERFATIRDVLMRVRKATPYMEKTILEALFRMGFPRDALTRMRLRYAPMLAATPTTLGEDFSGLGTTNHAWAGGPLYLLSRYVAGVSPSRPGYRTFDVLPVPMDLTSVKVTVPSVRGPIRVRLDRDLSRARLDVEVPPTTQAVLGLPLPEDDRRLPVALWVGGKPAGSGRAPRGLPRGLRVIGAKDGWLRFGAGPGTWRIEGRFSPPADAAGQDRP